MDCWDHVRWPAPPPPPPPTICCWSAGQQLMWCLSQHPNMWQSVHHHPLICEARGTGVTSNIGPLMACCAKRSGRNDRDTAWTKTFKFESLFKSSQDMQFTGGLQMLDKVVLNLLWSCDSMVSSAGASSQSCKKWSKRLHWMQQLFVNALFLFKQKDEPMVGVAGRQNHFG